MNNYKELQNLIKEYEKTKIWEYLDGDDIFKLEGFDKNIYISIMGNAKLDYGIGIYYGEQDLLSQMDISYGQYANSPDAFIRLKSYKIALGNPGNMLSPDDKTILKKNKLKANNVVFRLDAGCLPRIIDEKESLKIIEILKRIIEVANYVISNEFEMDSVKPEHMFSFSKSTDKIKVKQIKWPTLKFEFIKQSKLSEDMVNKMNWVKKDVELNIGLFYAPMFMMDTKKYPLIVLIHDEKSDLILDIIIIKENEVNEVANKVLNSFVTKKINPSKIIFNSNEIAYICQDIIDEFEILFRLEEHLEKLFDIWINMYESL